MPGAEAVVDELADALGGVDALVNNAGAGHQTPFLETELETFRGVLELDLVAPVPLRPAGRAADGRAGSSYVTGHSHVVDGGLLLMAAIANQRLS